jgi:hypothetical protein
MVALLEYRATLRYLWTADFEAIAGTEGGKQSTPRLLSRFFWQ